MSEEIFENEPKYRELLKRFDKLKRLKRTLQNIEENGQYETITHTGSGKRAKTIKKWGSRLLILTKGNKEDMAGYEFTLSYQATISALKTEIEMLEEYIKKIQSN